MRKAQKQQAEDFARLLNRAHDEIRKALERKDRNTARDLLEQCQDGAIELGNMIEAEEGEGFVTVTLLEAYCEALYQIHETIWRNFAVNGSKVCKNLHRMLVRIENSIRNDIKVRQEVVFLPYKASMWDSLESIWKAADEDPDCDAYVVPIPYYDKNPDGSFKEMHYEGNLYPKYVPVIRYESYDFAGRRPDMIYIHNPYDECNYVTSVHPFFYAKNIKHFTECLVYIPYYILDEVESDNEQAIKNMSHFCTVPGVIYADKVIVQSEEMRRIFIKVMTEFTAGKSDKGAKTDETANRKYWEEKILNLGSPKTDKVLSTKKQNLEIPDQWMQAIVKKDGTWKKIIFYNTGVTALLEHDEKMLQKMREVFQAFKEKRDEAVLLWRPHPLIQAAIESMRPQLWKEYEKITEQYKEENWGIYDDTADIDRAVVLSDGYYGDPSSVVTLCKKDGVLVSIQNLKGNTKKEIDKLIGSIYGNQKPEITYMTKKDNFLYFVPADLNALFSIDLSTGRCDWKCFFENEESREGFLGNAFSYDRYIVICPFGFSRFHVWDTKENQEKEIEIPEKDYNHSAYLPRMTAAGEKLLFFPSFSKDLYSLDTTAWKAEKLFGIYERFLKIDPAGYKVFSRDPGYIYSDKVYFSMPDSRYLAEYNIPDNDFAFYELHTEERMVLSGGFRECLYMLSEKGVIYEWNIESHRLVKKTEIECNNFDMVRIQTIAKHEEDLYYMSPNDRFGVHYNIRNNKAEIGDYRYLFDFGQAEEQEYHFSLQDAEGRLYFISEEYELLIFDLKDNRYEKMKLHFDDRQLKKLWNLKTGKKQDETSKGKIIYETLCKLEG